MMPRDGSPTEGRYTKGALRNAVVAQVVRYYTIGSQAYVDCIAPMGAGRWKRAPIVSLSGDGSEVRPVKAGGDGEDAVMAGSDKAAKAVLLFVDSYQAPLCIGFIRGEAGGAAIGKDRGDADPAEDADPSAKETDHATGYGGAMQILDKNGNVVVDTTGATEGHGNHRVQLREGAVMRVSRGGGASDGAPISGRLETYLAALEAHVGGLTERLVALEAGGPMPAPSVALLPAAPAVADARIRSAVLQIPDEGVGDA